MPCSLPTSATPAITSATSFEELVGEAEIDACRLETRTLVVVSAGKDATHLGAGSIESRTFQPVALHQPLLFPCHAIPVLAHVVDLSPDHHEPGRAQLEGGLDAGGRIDARVVETNLISQRHQEHWDHVGGPGRKHAMGARLAAPNRRIVHARQVVEDQGSGMRKLHARGRRQYELQSIVMENSAGGALPSSMA